MAKALTSFYLAAVVFLVLTGCSAGVSQAVGADDPARKVAVEKIRTRMDAEKTWKQRHEEEYSALRKRQKAGDEVGPQLEALKATRPSFADLEDEAWMIVKADPTDDAAFMALKIILASALAAENRNQFETPVFQAKQARLARIVLDNHLKRADFLDLPYVYLSDWQASVAYWEEVYRGSPHRPVRAEALFRLTSQYFAAWSAPDLTPAAREELRRQVQQYGDLMRNDYADTPAAKRVESVLTALNHSVSALGTVLPNIKVATVEGGHDALENYRGKVVLLDFWATWCSACKRDHPKLMALKRELSEKSFEIVSISADEKLEAVTRYFAKAGQLPWPQWYAGAQGAVLQQWGIQGYPTYLLVGADGVLQARTYDLNDILARTRALVAQVARQ